MPVERADPVRVSYGYRMKRDSVLSARVRVKIMVVADHMSARVA